MAIAVWLGLASNIWYEIDYSTVTELTLKSGLFNLAAQAIGGFRWWETMQNALLIAAAFLRTATAGLRRLFASLAAIVDLTLPYREASLP